MEQVREAVGVEEVLRGPRAPGVAGPQRGPAATTPPQTPLMMKLERRGGQKRGSRDPWPEIFL